ncbi:DNA polymerase epsilon subunit C [Elsinoe australis]|uniref:DNA polymerase epsilon subunit C n=1 Tax=Elsinoe australis TaxID=40998 RepID=A0A2P7Z209_9PEZI|nr:DNA polymerase epsilon subunit C [Elsinoe australis]
MSLVVKTASRLVTSNDELLDTLESIECLMIETIYHNNAGHLRRAWLINRRAMAFAQLMGMHTGDYRSTKILEKDTRSRVGPEHMWFRIVASDRYLSLMLGLSQGSLENSFAKPESLVNCIPVERMERMMTLAGGLVLQRNNTKRTDIQMTRRIDNILQEAAALMSPKWWSTPWDPNVAARSEASAFDETIRLMNQFTYHHLVVQLHLPYLLQPSSAAQDYEHNKLAAAVSSRAIITQFVAFRQPALTSAYCRGVDFIAFIASITLCLIHIEQYRQPRQVLQHQQLSDRGLLEKTLEIMGHMAKVNQDVIAQKISSTLSPLLAIEASAAGGKYYHACASSAPVGGKSQHDKTTDAAAAPTALHVELPHFGTIKIEQCPNLEYELALPQTYLMGLSDTVHTSQATQNDVLLSAAEGMDPQLLVPCITGAEMDEWALQGVDMALFQALKSRLGHERERYGIRWWPERFQERECIMA